MKPGIEDTLSHDHLSAGKSAVASWDYVKKIFTVPEGEHSTLARLETEISNNIDGYLRQQLVAGDLIPEEIERLFRETSIPENPCFVAEQTHFLLEHVVRQSVHVSSPSFIGHMTSAMPYFMLPLAKIMFALNQNLVKIETSKAFTPLERQVLGMLHRLIFARDQSFYDKTTQNANMCLGIFGSGGTTANIAALWVARNRLLAARNGLPGIRDCGVAAALQAHGLSNLAILVSERGHYSLTKAADLLGLGRQQCIAIPVDDSNRVRLPDLKAKIAQLKEEKVGIVAIIGIAGTTETGSVDPLNDMADLCAEERIHFHVDAAWGGPTLFSKTHSLKLRGIERADSVTFDAHKQLYIPVGAGMVLFRDPESASVIENHAHYIIRKGSRDLGRFSLEGSRPGMAMLVHSALRIIGKKGFAMLIENGLAMAQSFAAMIHQHEDFEVIAEPELNLLCYRFCPLSWRRHFANLAQEAQAKFNQSINALTIRIQKSQRAAGKSFVSRTTIYGADYGRLPIVVFRSVMANPLTGENHLRSVLNEQSQIARNSPEYTLVEELVSLPV
jgi:putative pyridoxal-dependent aspartate 1-decarboxylase